MTKKEKQYLKEIVDHNKKLLERVKSGEFNDTYKTERESEVFSVGIELATELLDNYING